MRPEIAYYYEEMAAFLTQSQIDSLIDIAIESPQWASRYCVMSAMLIYRLTGW